MSWIISSKLIVKNSKMDLLLVGSKQQLKLMNIPFIHVGEDQITHVYDF